MPKSSPTYATWESSDDEYFSAHREDSLKFDDTECGQDTPSSSQDQFECTPARSWSTGSLGALAEGSASSSPRSSVSSVPVLHRAKLPRVLGRRARFTSMKCSSQLNQAVNLRLLAEHIPGGNCIFDGLGRMNHGGLRGKTRNCMPNQATLYVRMKGVRRGTEAQRMMAVRIFSNGAMCMSGAKNYREVVQVSRSVLDRIRRTSKPSVGNPLPAVRDPDSLELSRIEHADEHGIRTDLVRQDFDLGLGLSLDEAYRILKFHFNDNVIYESEFFAGLRVKPAEGVTVVLYGTGRGYVLGSGMAQASAWLEAGEGSLDKSFQRVVEILWGHLKTVANLNHLRRASKRSAASRSTAT